MEREEDSWTFVFHRQENMLRKQYVSLEKVEIKDEKNLKQEEKGRTVEIGNTSRQSPGDELKIDMYAESAAHCTPASA